MIFNLKPNVTFETLSCDIPTTLGSASRHIYYEDIEKYGRLNNVYYLLFFYHSSLFRFLSVFCFYTSMVHNLRLVRLSICTNSLVLVSGELGVSRSLRNWNFHFFYQAYSGEALPFLYSTFVLPYA